MSKARDKPNTNTQSQLQNGLDAGRPPCTIYAMHSPVQGLPISPLKLSIFFLPELTGMLSPLISTLRKLMEKYKALPTLYLHTSVFFLLKYHNHDGHSTSTSKNDT